MTDPALSLLDSDAPSGWMRLRTLILLRWLAVLGQTMAILVASFGLGLHIPLLYCALVIGASAVFNLVATATAAGNRRLSEREALLTLLFDLCQLGALLCLTGGLENPFALLIMAPVTIGASVLTLRATAILAVTAVAIISLLALFHVPLRLASGESLVLPEALAVGSWAALIIGTAFLAIYARRVSGETFSMSQALAATQVALTREQQLAALGGVVAAAAHELGTPLATIKLAATELVEELADQPQLQEDALLVRAQAERCSRILRTMGSRGSEDAVVRFAPFSSVVEEAALPHAHRGIRIIIRVEGARVEDGPELQPELARQPEIIQGLRNLIQNAVDFAASTVWIDLEWTDTDTARGDRRRRAGLSCRPHRPHRRALRPPPRTCPWRAAGLRGHGPRPLHRQDAARAKRRAPALRQRHARRNPRTQRIRPRERGRRHRDLAARARLDRCGPAARSRRPGAAPRRRSAA